MCNSAIRTRLFKSISHLLLLLSLFTLYTKSGNASPPLYLLTNMPDTETNEQQFHLFLNKYSFSHFEALSEPPHQKIWVGSFVSGLQVLVKKNQVSHFHRGELYTYHLNKILGLNLVPPVVIRQFQPDLMLWQLILPDSKQTPWHSGETLSFHLLIPYLQDAYYPTPLIRGETLNLQSIHTTEEKRNALQWSNLIILDYLTAETDRLVSTPINRQHPDRIMDGIVYNLGTALDGRLVAFDNERSFIRTNKRDQRQKNFQKYFLDKLCLFDTDTVSTLQWLNDQPDPALHLESTVEALDPDSFRLIYKLSSYSRTLFNQRLSSLLRQIKHCNPPPPTVE